MRFKLKYVFLLLNTAVLTLPVLASLHVLAHQEQHKPWFPRMSKAYLHRKIQFSTKENTVNEHLFAVLSNVLNSTRSTSSSEGIARRIYKPTGDLNISFISEECRDDTSAFLLHVGSTEWAARMVDATGRPGAGFLNGRVKLLGDFDECLSVVASYQISSTENFKSFRGRYCTGLYSINVTLTQELGDLVWGLCLPDSCGDSDALNLANLALNLNNLSSLLHFDSVNCHHRYLDWSVHALFVLFIVIVFASVVLIATVIDVLLVRWYWIHRDTNLHKLKVARCSFFGERNASYFSEGNRNNWRDDHSDLVNEDSDVPQVDTARTLQLVRARLEVLARSQHVDEACREPLAINDSPGLESSLASESVSTGLLLELLLAFSAWTNTERLFNSSTSRNYLECINGIRVLSISWIILGHVTESFIFMGDNVGHYARKVLQRWTFQTVLNAGYAFDSFLVLSGLLVSFQTLCKLKHSRGRFNWFVFFLHRYLRITPVYLVVLGVSATLWPHLVDGPLYPKATGFEHTSCSRCWMWNLLYVQNLIDFKKNHYLSWGWYLAVDMQFYVLSPLMIVPLYLRPKIGVLISVLFFLATIITPFALAEARYYSPGYFGIKGHPKALGDQNYDLYISPYSRMAPYVTGVLTGYLLYMYKTRGERTIRLSWPIVTAGWIVAASTALAVLYGLFHYYRNNVAMNLHVSAIYLALSRPAWGLSVAWVIYTCVTGWAGPVNRFLAWRYWQPLSKLTYTVSLVHVLLIDYWGSTLRIPLYTNTANLVFVYLAINLGSFVLAFPTSIIFEKPVLVLQSIIFRKKSDPRTVPSHYVFENKD